MIISIMTPWPEASMGTGKQRPLAPVRMRRASAYQDWLADGNAAEMFQNICDKSLQCELLENGRAQFGVRIGASDGCRHTVHLDHGL